MVMGKELLSLESFDPFIRENGERAYYNFKSPVKRSKGFYGKADISALKPYKRSR